MANDSMHQVDSQRIASEVEACYTQASEEEKRRIQEEVDFCWSEKYLESMAEEITDEVMAALDEISQSEADSEQGNLCQKKQDPRAYRRKMEKRIQHRLTRIATAAMQNLEKRENDDKHQLINRTARALELWHEAQKKKLVKGDSPE